MSSKADTWSIHGERHKAIVLWQGNLPIKYMSHI